MPVCDDTSSYSEIRFSQMDAILFAIAILLPSAPTLIYLLTIDPFKYWLGQFLTNVLVLFFPLFLGIRPRTILFVLSPFAAITPVACAYAIATGYPPSILTFQILREANAEELSIYLPIILICAVSGLIILAGYWHLARRLYRVTQTINVHFRWAGLLFLIFALGKDVAANGPQSGSHILLSRLERIHPLSPIIIITRLIREEHLIPDRAILLEKHSVTSDKPAADDELCILVVGESSRKRAWGLYNNSLSETTPCLSKRKLILYSNATACGTSTIQSIPILITGAFPSNGDILPFSNPGLVEIFRLAGFHTAWLSTQNADGNISSFVTTFSSNAHEKHFLNGRLEHSNFKNPEIQNDAVMLEPLQTLLYGSPKRLFIVLHMLGSHMPYPRRYPPTHEKWALSNDAKESMWRWLPPFDNEQRTQIDRAYLNTVYFTDWFLDQVISIAEASKRSASIVYISDHGENDSSSQILPAGHASLTSDVVKIPWFFWLSPEFRTRHPQTTYSLEKHRTKKVSAQDLFSTLCGMYGLHTAYADKTRDLSSSLYIEHKRLVYLIDGSVVDVAVSLQSADH